MTVEGADQIASEFSYFLVLLVGSGRSKSKNNLIFGVPRVMRAESAEEAIREAYSEPPSTRRVLYGYAWRLASPTVTKLSVKVPSPEWGRVVS